MDLLVKHLGINTPHDLKQGQSFNNGLREVSLESRYSLLQDGSPSSLMTSIETMTSNDTTELSNLDNQFKQLLSTYTGLLNTVNREIVQEQQKYGPMSDYLGKRLKTNSQDTYINEYGYARNIPLSDVIDSSCPQSSDSFNNTCQGLSDAYGVTYKEPVEPNMYISSASYGVPGVSAKSKDVTDIVRSKVGISRLKVHATNALFSDPAPGFHKTLTVVLGTVGGNSARTRTAGENATLIVDGVFKDKEAAGTICKDLLSSGCQGIKINGGCSDKNRWHDYWRKQCPKTCGYCDDPKYNPVPDAINFGCAPDYAKEWWKHHSCKTKPSSSKHPGCDIASMNTAIFKKGPDMKPGEPCHLAGKNIRNSKTNQVAWVDLTGVKHAYPNSKMRDNLIGCNNKVTVNLDDAKFSNVPTGSPMTNDGICLNISINEQDYTKLLKLNKQLQVLAAKIVHALDILISKDSETETEIRTKKSSIHAFLKNLKKERKDFDKNKQLINTMKYQSEDSHVRYVSNKYHMIAWGLLVVGFGGFTIHQLSTRTSL